MDGVTSSGPRDSVGSRYPTQSRQRYPNERTCSTNKLRGKGHGEKEDMVFELRDMCETLAFFSPAKWCATLKGATCRLIYEISRTQNHEL